MVHSSCNIGSILCEYVYIIILHVEFWLGWKVVRLPRNFSLVVLTVLENNVDISNYKFRLVVYHFVGLTERKIAELVMAILPMRFELRVTKVRRSFVHIGNYRVRKSLVNKWMPRVCTSDLYIVRDSPHRPTQFRIIGRLTGCDHSEFSFSVREMFRVCMPACMTSKVWKK